MLGQGVHYKAQEMRHVAHPIAQKIVHFIIQRSVFHHFKPHLHACPKDIRRDVLIVLNAFLQPNVEMGVSARLIVSA